MHPESTPTWLVGPEIPPTQRIGTVLSGSYRLDAFLGQGLTGITYNAWHLRQKQPYAVKLLHRELQPSHERVLRLRTDLRVISGLRRQGFLPVELSFAPDGAPFLASELLIGETLRERLARGPLPSLAAGIVVAALARALGEAHKLGVVHGDLRPENVLLPSEPGREVEAGQPVLLDAVLHHLRRRPLGLDESLPLHKLAYLAPEQTSGEQATADAAGDMFALGAIFYECLTGKPAFLGDELEVVYEKLSQPPAKLQLPREVGAPPGLAEALDEVIAHACARSPADRYATMTDFLGAIDEAYKKSGLHLPPPDERVAIDTVLSQNKGLRKRTVAVKRIGPAESATATPAVKLGAADPTAGKSTPAVEPVKAPESTAAKTAEPAKLTPRPKAAEPATAGSTSTETPKGQGPLRQPSPMGPTPSTAMKKPVLGAAAAITAPAPVPAVSPHSAKTPRMNSGPISIPPLSATDPPASAPAVAPTPAQTAPAALRQTTPLGLTPSTAMKKPALSGPGAGAAAGTSAANTAAATPAKAEPSTAVRKPTPLPAQPSTTVKKPTPPPTAAEPVKAEPAKVDSAPTKKGPSTTAKHRAVRHTVKARDLGRLLAEVAAGRLDASQAMAMAAGQEDLPEPPPPAAPQSEEDRIKAEGRAAVLARAEAAKQNRQAETDQRVQRAQEQQKRILEQARQETLSRMRAEMAESREGKKPSTSPPTTDDKAPLDDADLLAEAEKQRQRLEQERVEAERQAAHEEKRAKEEAQAADLARQEAARAEAAMREAEQREAARAEAMRVHTEREAEARRAAEEAETERQRQIEEAKAAEWAAAEAQARAQAAASAAERARAEVEREQEMVAWEEGLVEIAEPSRPPAPPPEALRHKSEQAEQATAAAKQAEDDALEAFRRAEEMRLQSIAVAKAVEQARSAVTAAEQARAREAAELAEAVATAEAARARDQELLQLANAAAERASAAESARQRHVVRATRVTQALQVLKQVQDMAQSNPPPPSGDGKAAPASPAAQAANTGSGPAPISGPNRPEPSGIYAGYQLSEALRDPSGAFKPSQLPTGRPEFTGPYAPAQITPAVEQATQSPTRPMPVIQAAPPKQEPPPDVVEISAMLPGSAIPVPQAQAMLGHPGRIATSPHGIPMQGSPTGSGAIQALQHPGMSISAMHPMLGMGPDTRQMMMPQMMQQPPMPSEPSGVTLTVRQFVVTLTVTSLLSAIIGALIALLVMQRSQPPPIDRPVIAGRTPGLEPGTDVTQPVNPPVGPQVGVNPPVAPPTPPAAEVRADLAVAAVAPTPPTVAPTPPVPPTPTPPAQTTPNPAWRPASMRLPPLRLASELPLLKPRGFVPPPVAPGRPGPAATPAAPPAPAATPAATPAPPAPAATPAAPVETKPPAVETKPKPAQPGKPAKQDISTEDGLRNPFGP